MSAVVTGKVAVFRKEREQTFFHIDTSTVHIERGLASMMRGKRFARGLGIVVSVAGLCLAVFGGCVAVQEKTETPPLESPEIVGIELDGGEDVSYHDIDGFHLSERSLKVSFSDGSERTLALTEDMVETWSAGEEPTLGEHVLTIVYEGYARTFTLWLYRDMSLAEYRYLYDHEIAEGSTVSDFDTWFDERTIGAHRVLGVVGAFEGMLTVLYADGERLAFTPVLPDIRADVTFMIADGNVRWAYLDRPYEFWKSTSSFAGIDFSEVSSLHLAQDGALLVVDHDDVIVDHGDDHRYHVTTYYNDDVLLSATLVEHERSHTFPFVPEREDAVFGAWFWTREDERTLLSDRALIRQSKRFDIHWTYGLVYELDDDEDIALVTGYEGNDPFVVVPSKKKKKSVRVGTEAFAHHPGIEHIVFDNEVFIDDRAMKSMPNLTVVELPLNIYEQHGEAILKDAMSVTTLTVPGGSQNMPARAFPFTAVFGVEEDALPASFEHVRIHPQSTNFYPNHVMHPNLKTIHVPYSITRVFQIEQHWLFRDIPFLGFTVDSDNRFYTAYDGVLFDVEMKTLLRYPGGKTDAMYTMPSTVEVIATQAFAYNGHLKEIVFSESIIEIENQAVMHTAIETLHLPSSIVSIGRDGFRNNDALTSIDFATPSSLTTIGQAAFTQNVHVETLLIPASVQSIEEGAFSNMERLDQVVFESGSLLEHLGARAFNNNPSLKTIVLPDTLKSIHGNPFVGAGLESIDIVSNEGAFYVQDGVLFERLDDDKVRLVSYPNAAKRTSYTVPEGVEIIGSAAFGRFLFLNVPIPYHLREIIIGDDVTTIGDGAFAANILLDHIRIGRNVSMIGKDAFFNVDLLSNLSLCPSNPHFLYDGVAFYETVLPGGYRLLKINNRVPIDRFDILEGTIEVDSSELSNVQFRQLVIPESLREFSLGFLPALESIEVHEDNPVLKSVDGVLFSNDGKILHLYPSAKQGETYVVPAHVKEVERGAFRYVEHLQHVIFQDAVLLNPYTRTFNAHLVCSGTMSASMIEHFENHDIEYTDVVLTDDVEGFSHYTLEYAYTLFDDDGVVITDFFSNRTNTLAGVDHIPWDRLYETIIVDVPHPVRVAFWSQSYLSPSTLLLNEQVYALNIFLFNVTKPTDIHFLNADAIIGLSGTGYGGIEHLTFHAPPGGTVEQAARAQGIRFVSNVETIGTWNVVRRDEGVTLVEYVGNASDVVVPNVIDGEPVIRLGSGLFNNSPEVERVVVGADIDFSPETFRSAEGLKTIELSIGHPRYRTLDGVLFDAELTTLLVYPQGRSGGYIVPDDIVEIGAFAFAQARGLTSLVLADSVRSIGAFAFMDTPNLRTVELPQNLRTIHQGAFLQATSLRFLRIPSNVEDMAHALFTQASMLRQIVFEGDVDRVDSGVFHGLFLDDLAIFAPAGSKPAEVALHHGIDLNVEPFWVNTPVLTHIEALLPKGLAPDARTRDDAYDGFAPDLWDDSRTVHSSADLLYALRAGYAPVFSDETSNAYIIYEIARQTLREIIRDDMDEREKWRSVYGHLASTVVYDVELATLTGDIDGYANARAFHLEGVFLDGLAVCDGIAKAVELLGLLEGLDVETVYGVVDNVNHAWNMVSVDGDWYHMDVTFAQLIIDDKIYFNHVFFLVDDERISETHELNPFFEHAAEHGHHDYFETPFDDDMSHHIDSADALEHVLAALEEATEYGLSFVVSYDDTPTLLSRLDAFLNDIGASGYMLAAGLLFLWAD